MRDHSPETWEVDRRPVPEKGRPCFLYQRWGELHFHELGGPLDHRRTIHVDLGVSAEVCVIFDDRPSKKEEDLFPYDIWNV